MRISDWSSDVCSSDLGVRDWAPAFAGARGRMIRSRRLRGLASLAAGLLLGATPALAQLSVDVTGDIDSSLKIVVPALPAQAEVSTPAGRSEEHTSELQSLMRISYAVYCLKKKHSHTHNTHT